MTWSITSLIPFRRSSDSSSTSSSSSSSSSFPTSSSSSSSSSSSTSSSSSSSSSSSTSSSPQQIVNSAGTGTNSSNKTPSPSPTQITISATPHIPTTVSSSSNTTKSSSPSTVPTGAISPSETYTHESGFVLNGKIYSFKLNIPIHAQPQDSEKDSLNKAIQSYKDQFIGHLKKQNLVIVNSGKAFDIEFQGDQGYKLSQAQNTQQAPLEEKVHNDEAKHFANLICTSNQNAKFITSLLENPNSYPQQLPATPTPSPSNTPPPASSSPKKNDDTGSSTPAQNPIAAAPSQVAPPRIDRGQNTCFAASVLWYLHNDAEILTALPSAISSAQNEEKPLLEKLKTLLEKMQQGQGISKQDIEAFIRSLADVKSESQIKVAIGQTGDAREIIDYFQKKILRDKRFNILRDGGDQNNSIELKAKENSKKIQNSFEFTQEPNQLSDSIPLELTIGEATYRLTRALCYSGDKNNGHYTALVSADNGEYYHCDDLKQENPEIIQKNTVSQLLREKAVKLLYVKQPASPATSTSQSPKPAFGDQNLTSDSLNHSQATIHYHKRTNKSKSEYILHNDASQPRTLVYNEEALKKEIAKVILEEEKTKIHLNASEEEIREIRSYVQRVCSLNKSQRPTITSENRNLTFEAPSSQHPNDCYTKCENSNTVKNEDSLSLIDYFEPQLQGSENLDHGYSEIIFNLRSQKLDSTDFISGHYKAAQGQILICGEKESESNEQRTLDSFLEAISANPLPKDRKIRLIISKDILIKNFEKIEAALKNATEKSNNAHSKENHKNVPSTPTDSNITPSNPPSSTPKNPGSKLWNFSIGSRISDLANKVSGVLLKNSITGG